MWRALLLGLFLAALLPASATDAARRSYTHAAPRAQDSVRDPRKAAASKRKELRDQGVKTVRAKSPSDWPSKVPVPADMQLRALPPVDGIPGFLYESDNYIFRSPSELSPEGQRMIAELFECTYAANKAIGRVLPLPRTELPRTTHKYPVMLVRDEAAYREAGGPAGSAGVYMHTEQFPVINGAAQDAQPLTEANIAAERVLVPFSALGLDRNGRLAAKGPDISTHTLVHEITHQNFVFNRLPIALNEGWAEYVGYVPYIGTELDFDRGFSLIVHEAKRFEGTTALSFPFSLKEFLLMGQEEMYAYMQQGNASRNTYLLGCMLVAYYVHLDGARGIKAMREYMQARIEGEENEQAVNKLIEPHRNTKQLEKDFIRAWKAKGVKNLQFSR